MYHFECKLEIRDTYWLHAYFENLQTLIIRKPFAMTCPVKPYTCMTIDRLLSRRKVSNRNSNLQFYVMMLEYRVSNQNSAHLCLFSLPELSLASRPKPACFPSCPNREPQARIEGLRPSFSQDPWLKFINFPNHKHWMQLNSTWITRIKKKYHHSRKFTTRKRQAKSRWRHNRKFIFIFYSNHRQFNI